MDYLGHLEKTRPLHLTANFEKERFKIKKNDERLALESRRRLYNDSLLGKNAIFDVDDDNDDNYVSTISNEKDDDYRDIENFDNHANADIDRGSATAGSSYLHEQHYSETDIDYQCSEDNKEEDGTEEAEEEDGTLENDEYGMEGNEKDGIEENEDDGIEGNEVDGIEGSEKIIRTGYCKTCTTFSKGTYCFY